MGGYAELPRTQRVPAYLEDSPESLAILAALTDRAIAVREAALDAGEQMRVNTATWGLALWEELTGIETDESLSDAERRRAVTARLCGSGTCNAAMIARLTRALTGYDCAVLEQADQYTFTLRFVGDQTAFVEFPLDSIRAAVEEVKPAHLKFVIAGITWRDIEAAALTWAGLEAQFPYWSDIETKSAVIARD